MSLKFSYVALYALQSIRRFSWFAVELEPRQYSLDATRTIQWLNLTFVFCRKIRSNENDMSAKHARWCTV